MTKQSENKAKEAEFRAQAAAQAKVRGHFGCSRELAGVSAVSSCTHLPYMRAASNTCPSSLPPSCVCFPSRTKATLLTPCTLTPCHTLSHAQEQERIRWEEQRRTMQEESQRQAQLAQYNDELARKRQQSEHELQRQRNGELVALQEQAAARKEAERLRIEQQIQAERRAADQHAVSEAQTEGPMCVCCGVSRV